MTGDRMIIKGRDGKAKHVVQADNTVDDLVVGRVLCKDEVETHNFPAGSDRCSICGKTREEVWPEEEPVKEK